MREIGIRKVVGASVWDIVRLLTWDFSWLVLISNLIAWPVAFVLMIRWLDGVAYRIELSPLMFIGCTACAFLIAWVTVASVAARAATSRPSHAMQQG